MVCGPSPGLDDRDEVLRCSFADAGETLSAQVAAEHSRETPSPCVLCGVHVSRADIAEHYALDCKSYFVANMFDAWTVGAGVNHPAVESSGAEASATSILRCNRDSELDAWWIRMQHEQGLVPDDSTVPMKAQLHQSSSTIASEKFLKSVMAWSGRAQKSLFVLSLQCKLCTLPQTPADYIGTGKDQQSCFP